MIETIETIERDLDTKQLRRERAECKTHDRISRLEDRAERMVGVLVRAGSEVNYISIGRTYREGSRTELIAFLVRNKYV